MELLSVNRGPVKTFDWNGRQIKSAIDKHPVEGPVEIGVAGVVGDNVADPDNHSGSFKAVYLYDADDYQFWQKRLGLSELRFGRFGENLTTNGIDSRTVKVGDVFRFGTVEIQAVGPRIPCFKLDVQFARKDLLQEFVEVNRPGFYGKILTPGGVKAGDRIEKIKAGADVSVLEIFQAYHGDRTTMNRARFLNAEVLDPGWARLLQKL